MGFLKDVVLFCSLCAGFTEKQSVTSNIFSSSLSSLCLCLTVAYKLISHHAGSHLPSYLKPIVERLESRPAVMYVSELGVSVAGSRRYPGVVLGVPSCEATSPGMTHNSIPLSSCHG